MRFARHNLVRDPFPPRGEAPFDLIVCRNVLMYFDAPTARARDRRPAGGAGAGRAAAAGGGRPARRRVSDRARARRAPAVPARAATVRLVPSDPEARGSSADTALAAFDAGCRALGAGDAAAAVSALRRALYLDPGRAVVALQLARAHEALHHLEASLESIGGVIDTSSLAEDTVRRRQCGGTLPQRAVGALAGRGAAGRRSLRPDLVHHPADARVHGRRLGVAGGAVPDRPGVQRRGVPGAVGDQPGHLPLRDPDELLARPAEPPAGPGSKASPTRACSAWRSSSTRSIRPTSTRAPRTWAASSGSIPAPAWPSRCCSSRTCGSPPRWSRRGR